MARPKKKGLDYFPLVCKVDRKTDSLKRKFGATGFATMIVLYQHIYSEGYYCKLCEDTIEDVIADIGIEIEEFDEILQYMIKRGFFNKELYESENILTSAGIQKTFVMATKRRKTHAITEFKLINDDINPVNVYNNPTEQELLQHNVDNSTQRKEKKRKEKESKYNTVREQPAEAVQIASILLNYVSQHSVKKPKESAIQKWANDIRLLKEQDKVDYQTIQGELAKFVTTPPQQYKARIECGSALREKFEKVAEWNKRQAQQTPQHPHSVETTFSIDKRLAELQADQSNQPQQYEELPF